jgi:hypothetical protein
VGTRPDDFFRVRREAPLRKPLHGRVGLAGLFLAIDARRPASWLALAAGGAAGRACGGLEAGQAAALATAIVAAAAAATAAIGDLPLALLPAPLLRSRRGRRQAAGWALERAGWAAAGFAAGGLSAASWPRGPGLAAAGFCSASAAAITLCGARLAGATPADAAGLVLVLAAASGAAAAAAPGETAAAGAALAAVAWAVLAAGGWLWSRGVVGGEPAETAAESPDDSTAAAVGLAAAWREPLAPAGAVGRVLEWIAMAWALVAMAVWLVLDDESVARGGHAAAWAACTAGWFVALALPGMALQEGVADAEPRSLLHRSAAIGAETDRGRRARGVAAAWRRPGPVRFAASAGLARAAVLGWPPLVCALVALPTPARSLPPTLIVAGLAAAAAVASLVVAAAVRGGVSRETVFAGLLGAVICAAAWLAAARLGDGETGRPGTHRPESPRTIACLRGPVRAPSRAVGVPAACPAAPSDSC